MKVVQFNGEGLDAVDVNTFNTLFNDPLVPDIESSLDTINPGT